MVPSTSGSTVVVTPKAIDRVRARRNSAGSISSGKEHQQQLAEFRHEVGDRAIRAEEAEDLGANDDTADQQTHGCGNAQAPTKARDDDEQHHPEREFRERRKREQMDSDEV
ncbi:MAG TPA: hypothetical protein VGH36_05430 [Acetobacteraceae bacterium]